MLPIDNVDSLYNVIFAMNQYSQSFLKYKPLNNYDLNLGFLFEPDIIGDMYYFSPSDKVKVGVYRSEVDTMIHEIMSSYDCCGVPSSPLFEDLLEAVLTKLNKEREKAEEEATEQMKQGELALLKSLAEKYNMRVVANEV